ncbi:MAG: GatB/YqeY domain-containing protein [bacterium]
MALLDQLNDDLKAAMKSGEKVRVETIRLLRGQLKDFQINQKRAPSAEEEIEALMSAAKKRREAMAAYRNAGRDELADKESAELEIISSYLPRALAPAEIEALVTAAIQETGAKGAGDLGKVMGKIMPQIKGRADGKAVQQLVRERLG